jgi:hypothetical protein
MDKEFVLKDAPENRLYIPEGDVLQYWELVDEVYRGASYSVARYKLNIFIRNLFPDVNFDLEHYVHVSMEKCLGEAKPYLVKEEYEKKKE